MKRHFIGQDLTRIFLLCRCAVDLDVPGTVSDTKPVITSVVWTKNDEILLDEFTG